MLSTDSTSPLSHPCARAEALRDYAFDDQLPQDERRAMEQHLAVCGACVMELDQLRLTAAALRTLPDREIPQRIAFVSDRVFEPSAWRRFWNSGGSLFQSMLGFASACVLAAALVVSAWHYRPAGEIRTVVETASASPDQINAAVAKAVAQVRAEDAQMIQAAVEESGRKRDEEYRNQMIVIGESFDRLQKRLNLGYATMASNDLTGSGAGQ
jgi:anti-sigma factor RsiW